MTPRTRNMLRQAHLWLGLTVGALFVLLGLTGSVLVFYQEIDALLNPEIRVEAVGPAPDWSSPVWDRALATVRAASLPHENGQWRFEANGKPGAIPARYYAGQRHSGRTAMVWLSPDGERILRRAAWGDYLMTWIYDLHMDLLTGDTGRQVSGWSGLVMLVLLVTGVIVWWPRGRWRKALAFKPDAVPTRRLRDIHKLTGLWSFALLIFFALTGAMLALPVERDWVMTRAIAPLDPVPSLRSQPSADPQISISTALTAAQQALPDARLAWIQVPGAADGVFALRVQVPGDPSRRFPHSYAYVDQYSGVVLGVRDVRDGTASVTINNWLHPLHDASVGGLPARILAVIAGLLPAALFVTGVLHWQRRRYAARAAARRNTHR